MAEDIYRDEYRSGRRGRIVMRFPDGVEIDISGLTTNAMSLQEHQDNNARAGQRLLTREEAILVGHRPADIAEYFGADAP